MRCNIFDITEFYSAAQERRPSNITGLRNYINSFKKVIIWGIGRLGIDTCSTLLSLGIKVDAIWDKNPRASNIFSLPISKPLLNQQHDKTDLVIVCASGEQGEEIYQDLMKMGHENVLHGQKLIQSIRNPYNNAEQNSIFERTKKDELFRYQSIDGRIINTHPKKKLYLLTDTATTNAPEDAEIISNLNTLDDEGIKDSVFLINFQSDSDALDNLKRIRNAGGKFIPHIDPLWRKTHYRFVNRNAKIALEKTWQKHERVSHLIPEVHENICEALALTAKVPGEYVEIGVYLGGSALTALNYLDQSQSSNRSVWLFDTFDGFTYSEAGESQDPMWANTHKLNGPEDTISYIKNTLGEVKTEFHLIEANICTFEISTQVKHIAVANIDVDMYEPTFIALNKVSKLIPKGGIIICEDPTSTPGTYGAYLAMHEFLESSSGSRFLPIFKRGSYFLIAMSDAA